MKNPKIKFLLKNLSALNKYLNRNAGSWTSVHILVDSNTFQYCLPLLMEQIDLFQGAEIMEVEPGEKNKTIEIATGLWQTLSDAGADRSALMINVGGGVVTDMGGWVASTYKRGIDFIHIPTTLLGVVDASIGGKTAIDLDLAKNMVGTFSLPKAIFAIPSFLDTLPEREWLSGFAELLKHALIADAELWEYIEVSGMAGLALHPGWIEQACRIKENIVANDFKESGQRKTLNFGHTIGHAIESISMQIDQNPLSHGHAVAIGIKLANRIAVNKNLLPDKIANRINKLIDRYYRNPAWLTEKGNDLLGFIRNDKKNRAGIIRMAFIDKIGSSLFDIEVNESEILNVIR